MPKLQILMPDAGEITHELVDEAITLGRLPDNNIQVDDASVSSHHALFNLVGNGNYQLKDLNSTNGTRVNGAPVTDVQLRNGDRVRLGKIEAAYFSDTVHANAPLPAVVEPVATPAAESVRPTNFENASPFQHKHQKKDPAGMYIMIFAGVAIVAILVAVTLIFLLRPPV
jgi:pSer/pThr/pTyr-binding forkhead associated (FHA) protein